MVRKVRRTLSAILATGVADGFLRPDRRNPIASRCRCGRNGPRHDPSAPGSPKPPHS